MSDNHHCFTSVIYILLLLTCLCICTDTEKSPDHNDENIIVMNNVNRNQRTQSIDNNVIDRNLITLRSNDKDISTPQNINGDDNGGGTASSFWSDIDDWLTF
jgi:hypothetical protein